MGLAHIGVSLEWRVSLHALLREAKLKSKTKAIKKRTLVSIYNFHQKNKSSGKASLEILFVQSHWKAIKIGMGSFRITTFFISRLSSMVASLALNEKKIIDNFSLGK